MYIYICVQTCTYTHAYVYIIHICIYVCVYIYTYVRVYVCLSHIYIYIHIHYILCTISAVQAGERDTADGTGIYWGHARPMHFLKCHFHRLEIRESTCLGHGLGMKGS